MNNLASIAKSFVRDILGDNRYLVLGRNFREMQAAYHPKMLMSRRRINAYKDAFVGERCFILGNGPSLRKTDLSLLAKEYTFGLNRVYLLFDEIGFSTSFYVSVNRLVIAQSNVDIKALPIPKFIGWNSRDYVSSDNYVMYVRSLQQPGFYCDVTQGIWEGATVTYVAMQLAYFMGFSRVILIGVDHSFATKGNPHQEVVSKGEDPNHFHPEYFGKGFRWNLPDLETSEQAYFIAKESYESDGREIIDATIGGKLQIFPKVDYSSLFDVVKLKECNKV